MSDLHGFSLRLRCAIARSGLSHSEVARRIRVTLPAITHLLGAKHWPRVETLIGLCRVLDVSADYLIGLQAVVPLTWWQRLIVAVKRKRR